MYTTDRWFAVTKYDKNHEAISTTLYDRASNDVHNMGVFTTTGWHNTDDMVTMYFNKRN